MAAKKKAAKAGAGAFAAGQAAKNNVYVQRLVEDDELPEHLRRGMEFVFVDSVDELLAEALEPPDALAARRDGGRRSRQGAARGRQPVAARD